MAVGLNAIREICSRNSLAMTADLLQDLVEYKTTKSKTVMMAARSLMQLYRNVDANLLRKKDRGMNMEIFLLLSCTCYTILNFLTYTQLQLCISLLISL